MLTGRIPDESINRIRSDTLQPIRTVIKKLPGNVALAIDKGLSVMAENRQQTMEELYHELYMSRRDFRSTKRSNMYRSINKFLIRLIAGIVICLIIFCVVWIKRNAISVAVSRVAEKFVANENADPEEEPKSDGSSGKRSEEKSEEDDKPDVKEKESEKAGTTSQKEQSQEEPDEAQSEETEDETEAQDAGTQRYQMMRAGTESASDTDDSVIKVKDGRLNNIASGYTVGEILDLYSDGEGKWYTYENAATAQKYVYYEGQKAGSTFVLEFEVYENNTFKLTGAMQNDEAVERYSDFFQGILDNLGF